MPRTTPVFGFTVPLGSDPAYQLATNLGATVDKLEDVLSNYSPSPDVASVNDLIAAGWFTDSGWLALTIASGFAQLSSSYTPMARRIGQIVYLKGAFAPTGLTANTTAVVATMPAAIPTPGPGTANLYSGSTAPANGGKLAVTPTGQVQITPPATLGSFYACNGSYALG